MKQEKPSKNRINKEKRKLSIIQSSVFIFAQKGYHGTKVKDIAEAAGISEGLLFKYFPTKKDIYLSLSKYIDGQLLLVVNGFKNKEPGGKTLIELIYCLIMMIITDKSKKTRRQYAFERLLVYSIVENPEHLEHFFLTYKRELSPLWEKCMYAAKKSNELKKNFKIKNAMWFVHHLAMVINFLNIAGNKIFPYEGTYEKLVNEIIQFALMGTGLTDEVIAKYYRPAKLQKTLPKIFW